MYIVVDNKILTNMLLYVDAITKNIMCLDGVVVKALDLQLEIAGSIPAAAPLHCRVRPWTSCSHTLSNASGVTTLWRYINQFKFKSKTKTKISACEWQKFLSAAD